MYIQFLIIKLIEIYQICNQVCVCMAIQCTGPAMMWMDGWMDGCIDPMDRWVSGWVGGWVDGWIDG